MFEFERIKHSDGREFIKTLLQNTPDSKYFQGINYEILALNGISDNTLKEVVEGTLVENLHKFTKSFDEAATYIIGDASAFPVTVIKKVYLDGSCIILNRIIVPDPEGRFPWDDGCDESFKLQWNENDEAENQDICKNYKLDELKGVRTDISKTTETCVGVTYADDPDSEITKDEFIKELTESLKDMCRR